MSVYYDLELNRNIFLEGYIETTEESFDWEQGMMRGEEILESHEVEAFRITYSMEVDGKEIYRDVTSLLQAISPKYYYELEHDFLKDYLDSN